MCTAANQRTFDSCGPIQDKNTAACFSKSGSFLGQLLSNLPDTKNLENLINQHFWAIQGHKDSIEQLESIFRKCLQTNENLLSKKTSREKANEIFNAYREVYFTILKEDPEFQNILKDHIFVTHFPGCKEESPMLYIKCLVLEAINTMHTIVPGLALEKACSLEPYSLKLHASSSPFLPSQIDGSDLTAFYQQKLTKFSLHKQT